MTTTAKGTALTPLTLRVLGQLADAAARHHVTIRTVTVGAESIIATVPGAETWQAQQVLRDLGCPWDEINAAPNLVIGRPAGLDLAVALALDPAAVA